MGKRHFWVKKTSKKTLLFLQVKKKSLLSIKSHLCRKNVTSVEKMSLLFTSVNLGWKSHFCFPKSHFCPLNMYLHIVILEVNLFYFKCCNTLLGTRNYHCFWLTPSGHQSIFIPWYDLVNSLFTLNFAPPLIFHLKILGVVFSAKTVCFRFSKVSHCTTSPIR